MSPKEFKEKLEETYPGMYEFLEFKQDHVNGVLVVAIKGQALIDPVRRAATIKSYTMRIQMADFAMYDGKLLKVRHPEPFGWTIDGGSA